MKNLISAACIAALIALVPAVIVGYLHEDKKTNNTEVAHDDVKSNQDEGSILRLVKTF
ncbi:MAG: hypothetical protein JWQ30_582 [Sediminibacterium sp.]|nr:hypothetical protein [Sediminibacterium sp.]